MTWLAFIAGVTAAKSAYAFEREWHLGAGGGVVAPGSAYDLGPALAVHGAYGLSDVFDARLTLSGSRHTAARAPTTSLFTGTLGLAYKLDVIEWVPYVGVRAGYFSFSRSPLAPYERSGGVLGAMAGVDYSFSRSFALGAEVGYDLLVPEGTLMGALLHAEYRFGY